MSWISTVPEEEADGLLATIYDEKMLLRLGRTGRFLGCSGYPKCKSTKEAPPGLLREVAAEA